MATFVKEFMGASIAATNKVAVNQRASVVVQGATKRVATKKKVAPKRAAGGTKRVVKKAGAKKAARKPAAKTDFGPNRQLWYPAGSSPAWLDGTMIGDRGFDPLGLSKPAEYLQVELDGLDQNLAKNPAGRVIGVQKQKKTEVSTDALQPYSEVFDIKRFRECELIHGRWCMVASLGCLVAEAATGVSWVDAGKVELEGAQYLGLGIPFSISQLVLIEVLLMGYIEVARNSELDNEKRCYPGGFFDPFNLLTPEREDELKLAEIKHSRLAMVAMFIFSCESLFGDNTSPLGAIGF
jgi:light-harvesting complex II chlorophyll a/b binding protein 4